MEDDYKVLTFFIGCVTIFLMTLTICITTYNMAISKKQLTYKLAQVQQHYLVIHDLNERLEIVSN